MWRGRKKNKTDEKNEKLAYIQFWIGARPSFFFLQGLATKRWLQFLMKCLCCCTWTPWLSSAHQVQDPRRVIKHADRVCLGASHGEEASRIKRWLPERNENVRADFENRIYLVLFVMRHLKFLEKEEDEEEFLFCFVFWFQTKSSRIFTSLKDLTFWIFVPNF